jgi:hypothetical protein
MKIYHIEMSRFMDAYVVGLTYTSVTHFRIRTALQANKERGLRINLDGKVTFYNRPSHSLRCSRYLAGDQAKA